MQYLRASSTWTPKSWKISNENQQIYEYTYPYIVRVSSVVQNHLNFTQHSPLILVDGNWFVRVNNQSG